MDEVIKSRLHFDESTGMMYNELTQPTEDVILERNSDLRKDNVLSDLSFGRQIASVPIIAYEEAIRNGYGLNHPDKDVLRKELFRFLNSDGGKKYWVRDKL